MDSEKLIKIAVTGLWIFLLMLVQTAASEFLMIKSVAPDLLFAFSLAFACREEKLMNVLITALVCGVAADFLCHSSFAGCSGIYTYSALLMFFLKNLFIKPNIVFLSVIALLLFLAGKSLTYGVICLYGVQSITRCFENYIIPVSFYNTLCFAVMTLIFRLCAARREKRNEQI